MSYRPLFLFGVARGGTNLVAGMLNARKDARLALDPLMPFFKRLRSAILEEKGDAALIARYPERAPFQDYYFDSLGPRLLDATMNGAIDLPLAADAALAEAVAQRAALESEALPPLLAQVRARSFAEFLSGVIAAVAGHSGAARRWCGTKEVWTTEFIPVFARAMPHARFIVIRRDPRSILASLIGMMRRDETQTAHTISYMRHWRKEAAVLDTIVGDSLLRERVLTVRYEAITTMPERAAREICGFLDLPFDDAMLTPAAEDGTASRGNSSFGGMKGIADTSVARWRRVLDDDTLRAIECLCGPEMRAEGYELTNAWPVLPDAGVQRAAAEADANPGSWRSDSGDTAADLAHEQARWEMLAGRETPSSTDISRHFLFEPFFERLCSTTPQRTFAIAASVRGME